LLAHLLGYAAHADRSEIVDGKARVARVVHGEDALEALGQEGVFEFALQGGHAERFGEVLHEDFDEDARATGGFVFVEVDRGKNVPGYGVG